MKTKDLEYWKNNCEEDYLHTPISVLRYITELEQALSLRDVVGRSEQYHCELYDFGRKDKPCDKQCDDCKAMNLD